MPDGAAAGSRAFPSLGVRGGDLGGVTVLVTDQLPAARLASSRSWWTPAASPPGREGIGFCRATHASLEMCDSPVMFVWRRRQSRCARVNPEVSLWQVNASAVRAERWWSASRLVESAVVVIEGDWA